MRYLAVGFILAALIAAGMALQTGEVQGWVFCGLFGLAAAYLLLKK